MKTIHNKVAALLMAIMTLSSNTVGITANALSNTTEIENFSAPANISHTYTALPSDQHPIRYKDTYNSVYLQLSSATNDAYVQVWGLSDTNWNSTCHNYTCDANGNSTTSVRVNSNQERLIKNLVKEAGYNLAGLKSCSANYTNTSILNGAWAPDRPDNKQNIPCAN